MESLFFSRPSFHLEQTCDWCPRFKACTFCLTLCRSVACGLLCWVSTAVTSVLCLLCLPRAILSRPAAAQYEAPETVLCALYTQHIWEFQEVKKGQVEKSRRETFFPSASQHFWQHEQQYPLPLSISKVGPQCGLLKFLHILNLSLISLPLPPHLLSSKSKFKANYFKPKAFIFYK